MCPRGFHYECAAVQVQERTPCVALPCAEPVAGDAAQGIFPVAGSWRKLGPGLDVLLHELAHFRGGLDIGLELGFDEQAQGGVQGVAAEASVQY